MTRQLRPRKSKPSYLALAGLQSNEENEENHAGPSTIAVLEDENSSESDFNPGNDAKMQDVDEIIEDDNGALDTVAVLDEEVQQNASPKRKTLSAKAKGKAKARPSSPAQTPVGPPTAKRQNYTLPTPSVNHRHRAVPLYSRVGRVERLTAVPYLFGPPSSAFTNGLTENSKISERVNKSWGYNIGSGPLWDLAEDRGWYKEAVTTEGADDLDVEAKRRPRVYSNVKVRTDLEVLGFEDAAPYLPTDDVTTEEGNLEPPPPVPCYFGSIKNQRRRDMQMFESFPTSEYAPESNAYVFNAGGPVWGLDWCPIHADDRPARSYKQYLAVGPFPSKAHSPEIGRKVARPSYACIQIWSLAASQDGADLDRGEVKCEMVLCLDTGPAYELKWCPLPSHDIVNDSNNGQRKKLGLLAGTFEDGSLSVFVVPDPGDVISADSTNSLKSQPILRIELEETLCWTFDWANSELIAIGTTNGIIAVYNIGPALKSFTDPTQPPTTNLLPTHYLHVHQSAIRALAWVKAPPCTPSGEPCVNEDPTVIASAGYDGMECLTDIRQNRGSVMNRTRDIINGLAFSAFGGGPITMDHENTVKAYSASPSMLGRGHSLFEPQGPVWSVSASEYHPQLAVGAADGSCSTTNTLRSTRRGGSVPFFVHKIFQMDYNRNTKEYRMLDRFLPQESLDRPTATRASKAKDKDKPDEPPTPFPASTGAWPREVGVHRVAWNSGNGLASCGLLAAGTSSGLCRVDVLWGRWMRDKVPYGGVGGIRMEDGGGDAMEVDSEDEGEDE
ncbi:hypothetical protein GALMADRAFT_72049 [Galerina marginata CBS 339.88]|uniref:Uncharacterized protein n=1 Tax=Galerina marginata (strain CBS 339.88) TaxID=685588 RepID=A0A067T1K0_GALM3|nr:hypothetical protein GALMADRAFT_72049 [Galerina marginata CBS 339.88]